jgi:predicted DCC family thiol-disulfide oxidoreductase YuxK
MSNPILLYDGVCGLCNRFVQFTLRHDRKAVFRFANLQSSLAARFLTRHHRDPTVLETVYVVVNPVMANRGSAPSNLSDSDSELLLSRSEAVIFILNELGGVWRTVGSLVRLMPRFIRDFGYNFVARHRYRIFGRHDACPLPSPQDRHRFLDV